MERHAEIGSEALHSFHLDRDAESQGLCRIKIDEDLVVENFSGISS